MSPVVVIHIVDAIEVNEPVGIENALVVWTPSSEFAATSRRSKRHHHGTSRDETIYATASGKNRGECIASPQSQQTARIQSSVAHVRTAAPGLRVASIY